MKLLTYFAAAVLAAGCSAEDDVKPHLMCGTNAMAEKAIRDAIPHVIDDALFDLARAKELMASKNAVEKEEAKDSIERAERKLAEMKHMLKAVGIGQEEQKP